MNRLVIMAALAISACSAAAAQPPSAPRECRRRSDCALFCCASDPLRIPQVVPRARLHEVERACLDAGAPRADTECDGF